MRRKLLVVPLILALYLGLSPGVSANALAVTGITASCDGNGTITVQNQDEWVGAVLTLFVEYHIPGSADFVQSGAQATVTIVAGQTVYPFWIDTVSGVPAEANTIRIGVVSFNEKSESFGPCGAKPTDTPYPTKTPTDIPTDTPTPTETEKPTKTPTSTPTDIPTETPTATPTSTGTVSETPVVSETPTSTPTTVEETPTDTPVVPTETPKPTETPEEITDLPDTGGGPDVSSQSSSLQQGLLTMAVLLLLAALITGSRKISVRR